jgi:hypothetical protein
MARRHLAPATRAAATMAIMIPDSCPSKATVGEKRTFGLLRDGLPDHFTAWYEPVVAGRYPDFCLIADDFGLLMLEVNGWYAGQVARATDGEVELHRSEGGQVHVEIHKHPIRQVREYLFGLVDQLARPEYAIFSTTRASTGPGRASPAAWTSISVHRLECLHPLSIPSNLYLARRGVPYPV